MIDTHAHIDTEAFEADRQEVLDRAFGAGVEGIIIPAIEPSGFDKLLEVTRSDRRLYCSMGIHPHNALGADENALALVERHALENPGTVVAIGEIGLDYYYDFAPRDRQIEAFRRQVKLARQLNLPVIVHNREADQDILDILGQEQDGSLKGVLHCFSSPVEVMEKAVGLGFNVSFTGNITFKKTSLGEIVARAPVESIMIETDSPYMTPAPHRGKRNEPALVGLVAEKISEYKSISIEEVLKMTTKTAKELFRIGLFIMAFALTVMTVSAQSGGDDSSNDPGSSKDEVDAAKHPFNKALGFGFYTGFNTIVETYYPAGSVDGVNSSSEGIIAFGGGVFYQVMDYFIVEGSYMYSKDSKNAKIWGIEPNVYQLFEATTHWTANPYSRINVFASAGATLLHNSIAGKSNNRFGLNGGVGFYINLPVSGAGLFNLVAEWRLTFVLDKSKANYFHLVEGKPFLEEVDNTQFFSIPRVGLVYYPNILGR